MGAIDNLIQKNKLARQEPPIDIRTDFNVGKTQTSTPATIKTNPIKQGLSALGSMAYNYALGVGNRVLNLPKTISEYKLPPILVEDTSNPLQTKAKINPEAIKNAVDITVGLTGESGSIKSAIEKIAASKSAPEIASVLDKLGADKTLIPKFSEILTRVDSPEIVSKILKSEIKPSVLKLGEAIPTSEPLNNDPSFKMLSDNIKIKNISKESFLSQFDEGLKQPNLSRREAVQSIADKINKRGLTLDQFYDKVTKKPIPEQKITTPTLPEKPSIKIRQMTRSAEIPSLEQTAREQLSKENTHIPQSFDEFNKLSFEQQEKVFNKLPNYLQFEVAGGNPKISSAINELANEIINGKKIGVGKDMKTEAIENLGKGRYMKVFTKNPNASKMDELVDELNKATGKDYTTSDLVDEIQKTFEERKVYKRDERGIPLALNARERAIVGQANNLAGPKTNLVPRDTTTLPGQVVQLKTQPKATDVPLNKSDIPESIIGDSKKVASYSNSIQQQILDARQAKNEFGFFHGVEQNPVEFPKQVNEVRETAKEINLKEKAPKYKDIGNTKKQLRDIYRNTAQVFGKDFPVIDKKILEPFNQSKGKYIDTLNTELEQLSKNVVDKFNFQKGSKESQWIQLFGEKKKTLEEVIKKFGQEKALNIVEADKWFRAKYNELISQVNKVEQEIYPNNPEKWTPKRVDYYRHFHDLSSDFSRLQNILNNPVHIDPMLVGISEGTKPKSRWASFKQERLGIKTQEDAVGGYLNYLPSASYAIHIDPNIGKFRELAESLARNTGKSKNLNNYIYNLQMFANELAGKTAELDRIVTEIVPGGRTSLAAVDWVNKRVKSNTILANLSSSISQIFNIPQGIAKAGPINSAKGLSKTLAQNFVKNTEMGKSNFLKERYFKGFNKFDKGILNNTRKFAVWMVNVLDEAGTKFIWNGQYEQAIEKGIENPIKYADDATRLLVGGRGIGEKPLLQNSKVFQVIAPFQLEVTNLWWAMEDLAKSDDKIMKKFGQFASLFVSLYLLNNASEKITGNRVAFDPIQATIDAVGDIIENQNGKGFTKAGGRLAGEVLSNVPLGQTIASVYPELGGTVAGVKLPTRKEFFGRQDPTRFGGGLLSTKALMDPVYKIFPPFGGGQAKKTIEGFQALQKGKVENSAGNALFNVGGSPIKDAQTLLFGKYSGQGAKDYFNQGLTYAEATLENLKKSPTGKADLAKIIKENPQLAKNIVQVLKKQALGITKEDESLLNKGVANKQRAEEVAKQINKLKTKEEKVALVQEYIRKKIITTEVAKQLPEFLK